MRYTKYDLLDLMNWQNKYNYRLEDRKNILYDLLPKLKTDKLTVLEYYFITQSFFNEILNLGNIANDEGNYGNEFTYQFTNDAMIMEEDIYEYYEAYADLGPKVELMPLPEAKAMASRMISIYKEAKQWMIKKGYEV